MKKITGTEVNYYFICKRKLWLYQHHIQMEFGFENVQIGKMISEETYKRKKKEIRIDNLISMDNVDWEKKVVHEVKKTNKMEESHIWQLLYYIFYLKKFKGLEGFSGQIDYPKLKLTKEIFLTEELENELEEILKSIDRIHLGKIPTEFPSKRICKSCAYEEFCFS